MRILSLAYSSSCHRSLRLRPFAGCTQRRRVHEVEQLRARAAGRAACQDVEVDVRRQGNLLGVQVQDGLAALEVGHRHRHVAVEAAGAGEGGVEEGGQVGGADDDDALRLVEAVHLHQQLVQRQARGLHVPPRALGAHGVDLVDKDQRGRLLAGGGEQVADAPCAPTPTNISSKSLPEHEKKATCASPAMALASSVLPVPGGPVSRMPLTIFPPSFSKCDGLRR